PKREVDELAHAVADEDFLGRDSGDAARLLLHDHRLARGEDALLMAVALGVGEPLDHGEPHGLGRAQPEGPGVADVERDDLVALALELVGAPGEASADLVTHVLQGLARADGVLAPHPPRITALAAAVPQPSSRQR